MAASWPETKPLSEENLSDLVDMITQAEANIEAGKSAIAGAIADMNQPASPTDTYAQLAQKIRDISKDADASTADVVAGKTFYQGGAKRTGALALTGNVEDAQVLSGRTYYSNDPKTKRTGTMPNRGNISITLTQQGQEYTVPTGYHAGAGKVLAQFANLTPMNIRHGVDVGGVVGNFGIKQLTGSLPILKGRTFSGPNGGGFGSDKACNYVQIPKPSGMERIIRIEAYLDTSDVSTLWRSSTINRLNDIENEYIQVLNKQATSMSGASLIVGQSDVNYIYIPLYNGEWSFFDGKQAIYVVDWM